MSPDRLSDPLEHFPYKHDTVLALVDEDPPMGPAGPDDDRVTAADFMSADIADASAAYVAAQEAYLRGGSRDDYESAKADLVAARRAHRANRDGMGLSALARRA